MSAPCRIQLRRTKGWKMPPNTVSVARPTKWGNLFRSDLYGHEDAVDNYRIWINDPIQADLRMALPELRGKNLACWCPLPKPGEPDHCHAAVLLDLANK